MFNYRIATYKNELDEVDFKNLFEILVNVSKVSSFFLDFENDKAKLFIQSKNILSIQNSLLFPFKIVEDKATENIKVKNFKFRLINKKNISLLLLHEYHKRRKVRSISLKPIFPLFSKFNCLIGNVYFENNTFQKIYVSNLSEFLSFDKDSKIHLSKTKPEPKRNNIDISSSNPLVYSDESTIGLDNFDFTNHSFILGQSGSGKSKFIELICKKILEYDINNEFSIIVIDPHNNIFKDGTAVNDLYVVDYKNKFLNLFSNLGDPMTSTELSIDLFSTLIDIKENYFLYRVLKHSLFLLYQLRIMNFDNLKNMLTDIIYRKSLLKFTENKVIKDFFELEYMEIEAKRYSEAILPILNLISEFSLINDSTKEVTLEEIIKDNKVINITASVSKLGSKLTKLVTGSIIQQIFLISQSRVFENKKIILIIDEVSVIENPSLVKILAESRKFNLYLYMACQYMKQLSTDLKYGIVSNTVNYFCFKSNREDADLIINNVDLSFNPQSVKGKKFEEVRDEKLNLITSLNPRELLVRVMQNNRYLYPFIMKTVDI